MAILDGTFEIIGVACIVAFFLSFTSKAPYELKMVAFLIGSATIVLICMPFFLLRPFDYRNALIPSWGCRQLCKALGVTMEVRGLENVRRDHGAIILINHQSYIDLCVFSYLWPIIGRATVVSKKQVLYLPFFGVGAWLWGTLFIDRARKTDSINLLQKEAKAIKERNCKILVFPEGTRNTTDTLLPFKKGSFHIALQSQCAIQPVIVSKYWFLNAAKRIFKPGHAIIHILPEISTEGYSRENMDELIEKTRNLMQAEYTKLSQETKSINANRHI